MKTPYGKECPYFYGDYQRGKNIEDCRLLNKPNQPNKWKEQYCSNCPVPAIVLANACPNMILNGEVTSTIFGLKKKVKITAYCTKTHQEVKQPKIGCGHCHPFPDHFNYK